MDDIKEPKEQPKEELSSVQVSLDDKHEPIQTPDKPKDEPKYVRVEDLEAINKAINNTRGWNERKISNLESKIDQLLKSGQQIQPKSDVPVSEWDEKLQKDWKGTVSELARMEAQEILKREREQAQALQEQHRITNLLEQNKISVLKKHPELNDENSPKADIYRQIIQERPEYIQNPFGPVLAMRDMEDRLREQGVYDEPVRQAVNKEVARQARTNGTSIPKGSANPSTAKTITLSTEQKEFCDTNNIKYQDFAKYSSMLTSKREVSA
jgi:hypothetical protein